MVYLVLIFLSLSFNIILWVSMILSVVYRISQPFTVGISGVEAHPPFETPCLMVPNIWFHPLHPPWWGLFNMILSLNPELNHIKSRVNLLTSH